MSKINTPANIAKKLGTSERNIQKWIVKLGIEPVERIGRTQILSERDVRRLEKRKRTPGPAKTAHNNRMKRTLD